MRTVLQRVKNAAVLVNNNEIARINDGFLCLVGIHKQDNELKCSELAKKIINLRVFEDSQGKMNLSLQQIQGEILVVSQFTLYADCAGGNRPSFTDAMDAKTAEQLYERFVQELRYLGAKTKTGAFGAKMNIKLDNNGPVTIILDV